MKWKLLFFLTSFFIFCGSSYAQKRTPLNSTEEECVRIFKDFQNYIKRDKLIDEIIAGDSSINYILLNFLFIDRKLDTTGKSVETQSIFKEGELKRFKRDLLDYVRYFQEKSDPSFIDNIDIIPLRLTNDTFIYNQMTEFQKANTYMLFDTRRPVNALFYVLFFPPIKNYSNEPRIWSWQLGYQAGMFMFTSPIGEIGYEHIFP